MYNLFLPPPCMEGLKLNVLHITPVLYIAVLIIDCFQLIPFNKNIGTFEIFKNLRLDCQIMFFESYS